VVLQPSRPQALADDVAVAHPASPIGPHSPCGPAAEEAKRASLAPPGRGGHRDWWCSQHLHSSLLSPTFPGRLHRCINNPPFLPAGLPRAQPFTTRPAATASSSIGATVHYRDRGTRCRPIMRQGPPVAVSPADEVRGLYFLQGPRQRKRLGPGPRLRAFTCAGHGECTERRTAVFSPQRCAGLGPWCCSASFDSTQARGGSPLGWRGFSVGLFPLLCQQRPLLAWLRLLLIALVLGAAGASRLLRRRVNAVLLLLAGPAGWAAASRPAQPAGCLGWAWGNWPPILPGLLGFSGPTWRTRRPAAVVALWITRLHGAGDPTGLGQALLGRERRPFQSLGGA